MTIALILAALGALSVLSAGVLLRSLGSAFRIGRILSATPQASIAEAISLAHGRPTYVRVNGRISSDEEFPDEHDRPLVYRRTRIELAEGGGRWLAAHDELEAVPFGVETRSDFIAVDETVLGPGVVAIPRESRGSVRDLPAELVGDAAPGVAADAEARLVIEQLSAVEHATVCGRPALRDGRPVLTAGVGRPLIVTTLEIPAAMRLLAGGGRGRVLAAAAALLAGLGFLAAAAVAMIAGI